MRSVKRGERAALLYLDLDDFKPVNDRYGHAAGDALLKAAAARLRDMVRETDTVARLGGDEYVILQVGSSAMDAALLARRVATSLAAPFDIGETTVNVCTSIGIAMAPDDGCDPDQLLRKADHALSGYKARGRGHFAFYEIEGEGTPRPRCRVLATARRAIARLAILKTA